MEVRGVEPRSSEASASASPSAADSECSGGRDAIGAYPAALSGKSPACRLSTYVRVTEQGDSGIPTSRQPPIERHPKPVPSYHGQHLPCQMRSGPRRGRSVEVRGVEPRSSEASASASPSAADSECSGGRDAIGAYPAALSGECLTCRSRSPGRGIPHCDARSRRGGHPSGGRAAWLGSQCQVVVGTCMCSG